MKKIALIILFISCAIHAQKKEHTHSLQGITKVQIETGTYTKVLAGDTSELVIKMPGHNNSSRDRYYESGKNQDRADKRKGLTAIYPGGKDNTDGLGFSITKEGDVLTVRDLKSRYQRSSVEIMLPKDIDVLVDAGNLGSIRLEGFASEVEADTNVGSIKMKNVTGPITAHTSTGSIDIDFTTVSQSSPITISSSVSEIDVSLPESTKANLELRTGGTVYTNFDIETPTKKGLKNVSGRKSIIRSLNGGGVKIKIKSSMGNIYLRKK